jgi:hypothetical protein
MGDAKRRAIEIADLKANSPRVEETYTDDPLTIEGVFNPEVAMKRFELKGAPNWIAQKERPSVYGDRKHVSETGDEHRDAIIDNQRFNVAEAVTKRLSEKTKAETKEAEASRARIATGLSDTQSQVVSKQVAEGHADSVK